VFNLDEMEFQPPPPELGNGAVGGVDGIVHAGNRLIVLLNVESILRSTADIESAGDMATTTS
jgi:chemotaxis signal transduction protein